jgi:hypothetical protein
MMEEEVNQETKKVKKLRQNETYFNVCGIRTRATKWQNLDFSVEK